MTDVAIGYDWEENTFATDVKVTDVQGKVFIAPSGTSNLNSGVPFRGAAFFPAGTYAFRGPGSFVTAVYDELNAPTPFGTGDWSVADAVAANKATVTISAIPALGGFAIKSIDWSNDDGATWTSLTRKTTGTEDITTASDTILLRVVSEQGASAKSTGKAVVVS